MKNFRLIIITTNASSICVSASPRWLCTRNEGSGQFHMLCPIVIYISSTRKITEYFSRFFSFGVSRSFSASSSAASRLLALFFAAVSSPFRAAPYPACSTAWIIAFSSAVPSTPIELVRRDTEHEVTPGTFETAFSTRAWHAAQLMPVTTNCSILLNLASFPIADHFISFCTTFTNSSMDSVLPSFRSSATQPLMCSAMSTLLKLFRALVTADT